MPARWLIKLNIWHFLYIMEYGNKLTPMENKPHTNLLNNIDFILCNTSHPGNIGAAARAIKTMGLYNLTLVAPLAMPDDHSLALSSNAKDVVLNAKITENLNEAIAESHLVIALTGRKREFSDRLQSPKEILPEIFSALQTGQKVSIVFGNEQSGLTIEQLEQCNRMVSIPGNSEYFSLNLAQAVQIIAYEIYSNYAPSLSHLKNPIEKINQHDLQHLLANLDNLLVLSNYYTNKNSDRVRRRLQKILHKANLEREEADLLHGILKKLQPK